MLFSREDAAPLLSAMSNYNRMQEAVDTTEMLLGEAAVLADLHPDFKKSDILATLARVYVANRE